MATILFSKPVAFPIAPLREMLTKKLPLYRWQCGEADTGAAKQMGSFADKPLICGRSDKTVVFVETRPTLGTLPAPAPPHQWWLHVGRPTTELEPIADRVTLVVCIVSMILDEDDARCQLVEGGAWLTGHELVEVLKAVEAGQPLALAAAIGRRPATADPAPTTSARDSRYADLPPERAAMLASMDESLARILHDKGMGSIAADLGMAAPPAYAHETPRDDALPTLVLLSTAPLFVDWRKVEEGLTAIDSHGGWSVTPNGPHTGTVRGRGAVITLASEPTPLPPYLLAQGMAREHFLRPEQRAQLTSHRCRQAITVALDTRAADFVDVRQAAKAAAMLMAPLAIHPGCVGLFNAGTGVATPVDRVRDSIGALAQDEVPIAIWTWTAVDSAVTDAVSLSTAGLRPFVGFEVECWNAPGDLTSVAERLNGVMRYLLMNGPVIKHGDTIGDTAGDRSTRCFLGHSKAQRGGDDVPAMLLEFDGRGGSEPQPDVPQPPAQGLDAMLAELRRDASVESADTLDPLAASIRTPPAPGPGPTLVSFLALTKPVGIPATDLLRELHERIRPYRWTLDQGDSGLNVARLLTGTGPAGTITVRLIGETVPLPPSAGAPPHRLSLRVDTICGTDRALAGRIAAVVCCCVTIGQNAGAHGKLSPGSAWLDEDTLLTAMSMAKFAPSMEALAPDLGPATAPRPATPLRRVGGFGRKGL